MAFTIEIPASNDSSKKESIEIEKKLVLIGANGSGKSRLGAWIEKNLGERAVRVTAQKSLEIPNKFTFSSATAAYQKLNFGSEGLSLINRDGGKYGGNPTGKTVNDFEALLQLLFARDSESAKRVRKAADSNTYNSTKPILSELQRVKNIWEKVLPHRSLNIELEGELKAAIKSAGAGDVSEYLAGQMSDGERVVFYLVGKCLVAPQNSVLIIDEPELHLHPAVRDCLWGAIEAERSDCIFVYITHDIDFALSRKENQAIWLQNYDGKNWTWLGVTNDDCLPEGLQLEILGSRRPVLFVEGIKGSLDERLYSALYPNFLVQPCSGCSEVIQYTRAARKLNAFHNIKPSAIIDADNRASGSVDSLRAEGVFVLNCLEIENLLWAPEVLKVMAEFENYPDAEENAVEKIINEIMLLLEKTIVAKVAMKVQTTIQWSKSSTLDIVKQDLSTISAFDVDSEAEAVRVRLNAAISRRDIAELMKIVEHKHIHRRIADCFGLTAERYSEKIINYLHDKNFENAQKMANAFTNYIPEIHL